MNERVFMQLEMDRGLRARFQQATAREHRPAAQVMQQLMREYVVRHSDPGTCLPSEDRDLEALAHRQQGWGCCPFGTE